MPAVVYGLHDATVLSKGSPSPLGLPQIFNLWEERRYRSHPTN